MKSLENLKEAFAGESQANRRYLAFAKKAEADGFPQVARLFRAAAAAETVHAHAHLRAMNDVGSTLENLTTAVAGEAHEFQKMYPGFVQDAIAEAQQAALKSFKNAIAVEEVHHKLYSEAAAAVQGGKELPTAPIHVCEVCGHTVGGEAPDKYPICGARKEKFTEVK
jgi:rubrerythrin